MPSREERARRRRKIRRIIRDIPHLPTIPTIMLELQEVLSDPHPRPATLARIIGKDVSTAGRLLKVVNSSPLYAGATGEVWDIAEAVRQVGVMEIRRLASTLSVVRTFPDSLNHLDYTEFWRHSLGVAGAARLLAVLSYRRSRLDPEEAYTAGLLHDVGWLLLDQYLPDVASSIMQLARARRLARLEAEREVLGTDHGEVGGMLLERWNLPAEIIEAVSWHHDPETSSTAGRNLARLVHVSDHVCRRAGIGDADGAPREEFPAAALQRLGIPWREKEKTVEGLVGAGRVMADIIVHLPPGTATGRYPRRGPGGG